MNILKAIIMGIVQGITEFLPVSSSGHLAIMKKVLHLKLNSGVYFDVMLHLGTLVALIIVFREDLKKILTEVGGIFMTIFVNFLIFIARRRGNTKYTYVKVINSSYRKLVIMVLISTIPTGILGMVGGELVDKVSENLIVVGICLIITAVLLFLADKQDNSMYSIKNAPYSTAFIIGVTQGIATMPGLSRSGTTISTALMLGYNKRLAVRYSFIMSIPAIFGAVIVKLTHLEGEAFGSANLPGYLLGTIFAGIVGFFSLKYMLRLVRTKRYIGFSIYCLILGVIAIGASILS